MEANEIIKANDELQKKLKSDCLEYPKACRYMASRNISPAMFHKWGIGYCREYYEDHDWRVLYKRLTFPIWDWRGRHVSFAGRTLKEDFTGAKYIGLADNKAFKKSAGVYGLNYALPHIVQSRVAIVVEGYTDVIGMHDLSGIQNVVGSMGVAVTAKQIQLLARWAKLVIIILDGDKAGAKAMERTVGKLKDAYVQLGYVHLPQGKDPFDLSQEMGTGFGKFVMDNVKLTKTRAL